MTSSRLSLDVGEYIDVQDSNNKWTEAIILTRTNESIRVHFLGWSSEWDETLSLQRELFRIAPLHTYSTWTEYAPTPPSREQRREIQAQLDSVAHLRPGELIWLTRRTPEASSPTSASSSSSASTSRWYEALILKCDGLQFLIRYGSNRKERWIHLRKWQVKVRRRGEKTPPDDQQLSSSVAGAAAAVSNVPPIAATPTPSASQPSFFLAQSLDARDGLGKWLPACVRDLEDRGPLVISKRRLKSIDDEWELDATGQWQPKGGMTLYIHFQGFNEKWDEWIHSACYIEDPADDLGSSLRPRLAPPGTMTVSTDDSSDDDHHPFLKGCHVEVLVYVPIDSSTSTTPSFQTFWHSARIQNVEGSQIHIKYEPALKNTQAFRWPIWFHVEMGEVRMFGEKKPWRQSSVRKNRASTRNLLLSHHDAEKDEVATVSTPTSSLNHLVTDNHFAPPPSTPDSRSTSFTSATSLRSNHSSPNTSIPFIHPDLSEKLNQTSLSKSKNDSHPLSRNSRNGNHSTTSSYSSMLPAATAARTTPRNGSTTTSPSAPMIDSSLLNNSSTSTDKEIEDLDDEFDSGVSLSAASSRPPASVWHVGDYVDVRSIETGLWSEARVVGVTKESITVQLLSRATTQLIESIDFPYMLAKHKQYSCSSDGAASSYYSLGDQVQVTLHTMSNFELTGCIKDIQQAQLLVYDEESQDEFWVHPVRDQVKLLGKADAVTRTMKQSKSDQSLLQRIYSSNPSSTSKVSQQSQSAASAFPSPSSSSSASTSSSTVNPYIAFYSALLRRAASLPLRQPVGIVNLGNTCYIGSGLQCLAGLQPLLQYFVADRAFEAILRRKNVSNLTSEFAHLMASLHSSPAGTRLFPDRLKKQVVQLPNQSGERFYGSEMQDAHEFMAVLLAGLQAELNTGEAVQRGKAETKTKQSPVDLKLACDLHWSDFLLANNDPISHLFYGQSAQFVVCSRCSHPSPSYHTFGQFTLDVPSQSQQRQKQHSSFSRSFLGGGRAASKVTLEECIRSQLDVTQLEDYLCEECRTKQHAVSYQYFTHLPPILLIQLKRFDSSSSALTRPNGSRIYFGDTSSVKDETPCEYPMEMNLADIMRPHSSIRHPNTTEVRVKYRLSGVLIHSAQHYTAFTRVRSSGVRSNPAGSWCYFNDSKAYTDCDDEVLAQQKHVYVLLYQRID